MSKLPGEVAVLPSVSPGEAWSGEIVGVGLQVGVSGEVLSVVGVIEGAPASKAGMQAGDSILSIDGKPTAGVALADAVGKMRGVKGTYVTLGVMRAGWPAPRDFTLVRDVVKVEKSTPQTPESVEATIESILKGR